MLSGEYKQFGQLTALEIEREGLPTVDEDGQALTMQDKIILLRRILSLYRGVSPYVSFHACIRLPVLLMVYPVHMQARGTGGGFCFCPLF